MKWREKVERKNGEKFQREYRENKWSEKQRENIEKWREEGEREIRENVQIESRVRKYSEKIKRMLSENVENECRREVV